MVNINSDNLCRDNDRFIINDTICYIVGLDIPNKRYIMEAVDIMDQEINEEEYFVNANELPLPMYDDYYLGEMSSIGSVEKPSMSVWVNPDPGRIGNPYFKVYDSETPKANKSKVMRLHFFDSGMEYHQDKYLDWVPKNKELKMVKEFLEEPNDDFKEYSNWDICKFMWNVEYHFFPRRMRDDYFAGKLDGQFKDHPSYVPSTTSIPETWEYNPPKGKNKRR